MSIMPKTTFSRSTLSVLPVWLGQKPFSSQHLRGQDTVSFRGDAEVTYKDHPDNYYIEEFWRPDEMGMIFAATQKARDLIEQNSLRSKVADICCGPGLSMNGLAGHPKVSTLVGVDISSEYIGAAKNIYKNGKLPTHLVVKLPVDVWQKFQAGLVREPANLKFLKGDAVTIQMPDPQYDVMMLASAYHHIEDARKVQFLKHIRDLLGTRGKAVIAENILPEYKIGNPDSYKEAIQAFYTQVIASAKAEHGDMFPSNVETLIQRVAQYGNDGEYEYKVSLPILKRHLAEAGLKIDSIEKVWPSSGGQSVSLGSGGNYVLVVSLNYWERFKHGLRHLFGIPQEL